MKDKDLILLEDAYRRVYIDDENLLEEGFLKNAILAALIGFTAFNVGVNYSDREKKDIKEFVASHPKTQHYVELYSGTFKSIIHDDFNIKDSKDRATLFIIGNVLEKYKDVIKGDPEKKTLVINIMSRQFVNAKRARINLENSQDVNKLTDSINQQINFEIKNIKPTNSTFDRK
jgi:hypothetical protein